MTHSDKQKTKRNIIPAANIRTHVLTMYQCIYCGTLVLTMGRQIHF